jgi:hypothetical protein
MASLWRLLNVRLLQALKAAATQLPWLLLHLNAAQLQPAVRQSLPLLAPHLPSHQPSSAVAAAHTTRIPTVSHTASTYFLHIPKLSEALRQGELCVQCTICNRCSNCHKRSALTILDFTHDYVT